MNNGVGKKIKSLRSKLGLTMDEFGYLVDYDEENKKARSGTVSNWEQGLNKPNSKRLKRIAELGNTTVDELLKSEYESCSNCKYDVLKDDFNYCPKCGFEIGIGEKTKKSS